MVRVLFPIFCVPFINSCSFTRLQSGILLDYWLGQMHEMALLPQERLLLGIDKMVTQSDPQRDNCSENETAQTWNLLREVVQNMNATCIFIPWSRFPSQISNTTKVCNNLEEAKSMRRMLRKTKSIKGRYYPTLNKHSASA